MPRNLFAACRNGDELTAKRVRLERDVQHEVQNVFAEQVRGFREGVESEIPFTGSWTPDEDEVFSVDALSRSPESSVLIGTIRADAASINEISSADFEEGKITALFTGTTSGDRVEVYVQKFSPQQILSRKFALILGTEATFSRLEKTAFALDTSLACIIEGGKLKFKSFYKLRSIINVTSMYSVATDADVQEFSQHPIINVADAHAFAQIADQTSRKIINAINKNGTLCKYTIDVVQNAAREVGMEIDVADGKILMPNNRSELKKVLRFLDDAVYRAPLTKDRYMTNSKRKI